MFLFILLIVPKLLAEEKLSTSVNIFAQYSTDEHLRSLLHKQANSLCQVIVTIIGGDSYSIFVWDWYERMLEISARLGL